MDFINAIVEWGRCAPDRVAHASDAATLTYGALIGRANALAAWLLREAPEAKRPVVLLGHREPQLLVGMLACALSRRPYVPIDDSLPEARVSWIARASGASHTLTPADIDRVAPDAEPVVARDEDRALPDPDDLLYVMFTSGSTGEPKGVQITHGCLSAFLGWMTTEHDFALGAETFLNQANFSFDLSVMDIYLSLVTGGTLVSATREHANNLRLLFSLLRSTPFTTWVSTPTFAAMCLADPAFDERAIPTLKRFLFCGEVLPHAVARALLERFPKCALWNTYGPTEATVATTSIRITPSVLALGDVLPIGVAMPGTTVDVRNDNDVVAANGERGELVICGPNVSVGYLGRDDLTQRAFFLRGGLRAYRTGDWGRARDGLLYCEGRRDNQIKLRGFRIELGEIEAQLRRCPDVSDAIVVVSTRDGAAHSLIAVVVAAPAPNERDAAHGIKEFLSRALPSYMIPRHVRFLEQFPMTPNGKADRRTIAEAVLRASGPTTQ